MSFGFGVGDFLAGASLAYKLYEAVSSARGSEREFAQLRQELLGVNKVLLQIEQLRANNQLTHDTLNALLFLTNGISEAIETFMPLIKPYEASLQKGGSGKVVKDVVRKVMWKFDMSPHIEQLRDAIGTNLLSLNILVQVACYFGSKQSQHFLTNLEPNLTSPDSSNDQFSDIATYAYINASNCSSPSPNFERKDKPNVFFRPGQVFSIQCEGTLQTFSPGEEGSVIDWNNLPLDKMDRLEQILKLPLDEMFEYAIIKGDNKVMCSLCPNDRTVYSKQSWIEEHFTVDHFNILRDMPFVSKGHSREWISLNEISLDKPFMPPWSPPSTGIDAWAGSILLRRFVVVREGTKSCLCLGIHTYAGRGCSDQTDQEFYGILHSSRRIPTPFESETQMHLEPIRMKADHPSSTLPDSARIHFGHIYKIDHDVQVKPLGLIHDISMDSLFSQFESCALKSQREVEKARLRKEPRRGMRLRDVKVLPADVEIVKDIRKNIHEYLDLENHPKPFEGSRRKKLLGLNNRLEQPLSSGQADQVDPFHGLWERMMD